MQVLTFQNLDLKKNTQNLYHYLKNKTKQTTNQ